MTVSSLKPPPTLVLASSSRYRLAQLEQQLGLQLQCIAPEVDEAKIGDENAAAMAQRLSIHKAEAVLPKLSTDSIIIAGDQTATFEGKLLRKPGNSANAIAQLQSFRGKSLSFYSGVCVLQSNGQSTDPSKAAKIHSACVETRVQLRELSDEQIESYIKKEEPFDCVGAFKVESLGIALFEKIESEDPSALTGLPLIQLTQLLEDAGVDVLCS